MAKSTIEDNYGLNNCIMSITDAGNTRSSLDTCTIANNLLYTYDDFIAKAETKQAPFEFIAADFVAHLKADATQTQAIATQRPNAAISLLETQFAFLGLTQV